MHQTALADREAPLVMRDVRQRRIEGTGLVKKGGTHELVDVRTGCIVDRHICIRHELREVPARHLLQKVQEGLIAPR